MVITTEIHRREFLAACTALAASVAAGRIARAGVGLAARAAGRPDSREVRSILGSLVRTILPFEHPRFPPVSPETIEARLLAMFPVDTDARLLPLQQALQLFNELDLFPQLAPALEALERDALDADPATPAGIVEAALAQRAAADRRSYQAFRDSIQPPGAGRFTELTPAARSAYLRLWGRSGFTVKRRFYRSAKGLVTVTAYSMEQLWRAIAYAGPLLERRP